MQDNKFIVGWICSLFIVWYVSVGLYLYDPYILQIMYWPLHTHDIEIDVVESTVDWQFYIDKLDRDLEKGYLYIDDTVQPAVEVKEIIIENEEANKALDYILKKIN